ncbi:MAG: YceI family protein [Bdellovibrionota bacterium]|nr:YceI family protein [Bdellovibrionota bacterium]
MKNLILLITAMFVSLNFAQAEVYKFENNEKGLQFVISKNVKKGDDDFGATDVVGHFKKYNGSFDYDAAKNTVKDLKVEIEVSSIDTDMPKRDKHLRSADFFNVEDHPKATFISEAGKSFKVAKDGSAEITGNLKIKDVSKAITLKVNTKMQGDKLMIMAPKDAYNVTFDRRDYGIKYNKTIDDDLLGSLASKFKSFVGKNVIGDLAQIKLNITATK